MDGRLFYGVWVDFVVWERGEKMEELYEYRKRLMTDFAEAGRDLESRVSGGDAAEGSKENAARLTEGLRHLWAVEVRLFQPCLRRILTEQEPFLDCPASPGLELEDSQGSKAQLLEQYLELRRQELEWARNLQSSGWIRRGYHPRWGWRTFQWWLERSQAHLADHLRLLGPS